MLDEEGLRALQERALDPPSLDAALAASKELVEALTPLAAEDPAKYRVQLATAWKLRGVHLRLAEQQAEADEAFATAADLFRGLATVTDPESVFTFAISLIDLADHRLQQDDAARRALEPIEEIRNLGESLARDDAAAAADLQTHAARLHALALHALGDHQAAVEQAEQARAGLARMERRAPEARSLTAENLRVLGLSLKEVGRLKDARKRLESSAYLFGRLAKRDPGIFLIHQADTTFAAAAVHIAEGKKSRAATSYEVAVDLYGKAAQINPAHRENYKNAVTTLQQFYADQNNTRATALLNRRHPL